MLTFRPATSTLAELDAKLLALQADVVAATARAYHAESVAQAALTSVGDTQREARALADQVHSLAETLRGDIAALVAQTTARLDAIIGVPTGGYHAESIEAGSEAGPESRAESGL